MAVPYGTPPRPMTEAEQQHVERLQNTARLNNILERLHHQIGWCVPLWLGKKMILAALEARVEREAAERRGREEREKEQ